MHQQHDNRTSTIPQRSAETDPLLGEHAHQDARQQDARQQDARQQDAQLTVPPSTAGTDAWQLVRNAIPLILAGFLQQSLGLAAIFQIGHLGKTALGAVSLAIMTANVTGFAVYQGMATALETLCAQAYGSGNRHLVGLHFQQMLLFLWILTIPIAAIWYNADTILTAMVPDRATAELAGAYLKVLIFGAPGYAAFEAGKRYVQAQGIFHATTYILLLVAPLNAFLNWFFVVKMGYGFIGAPLSAALMHNLLPVLLLFFVAFIDGKQCWGGFSMNALRGWKMMTGLALPGFIMMEAEYLAFEMLALAASHLSGAQLAAQSILSPLLALTLQVPLAVSIAASTSIGRHIGNGSASQAARFAKIATCAASLVGVANFGFFAGLGGVATRFLTDQHDVIHEVARALPVIALFQLFDSLATTFNGLLRGLGRQRLGSLVCIFCYYFVAVPVSLIAAFKLKWELAGLWSGVAVALALHTFVIGTYLMVGSSWQAAVIASRERQSKALVQ